MSTGWAKAALCSGVSLSALRHDDLIRAKQLSEAKSLIVEALEVGLPEEQILEATRIAISQSTPDILRSEKPGDGCSTGAASDR